MCQVEEFEGGGGDHLISSFSPKGAKREIQDERGEKYTKDYLPPWWVREVYAMIPVLKRRKTGDEPFFARITAEILIASSA